MMRYVLYFVLALLLAGFELGLLSVVPWPAKLFSPSMLFLIVVAIFHRGMLPWLLAVFTGLLLDTFSIFPYGTFVLLGVGLVGLITFLFYRFFTNHSLLVFVVLGAVGAGFFFILLTLIRVLTFVVTKDHLFALSASSAALTILLGTVINSLLLGIFVFMVHWTRERLARRFIIKRYGATI